MIIVISLLFFMRLSLSCEAISKPAEEGVVPAVLVREQLVGQQLLQRLRRQVALEHAADGDGDRARLLGDDHDDGVGDLARADAGAVPGPEIAAQMRVFRQRHDAAGRGYAAVADHDGPVVQGRLREKQVAQQLLRHAGVDQRAGLEVFLKRGVALKNQQDADLLFGHDLTGVDRGRNGCFLRAAVGGRVDQTEERPSADFLQSTPELRLEHDHQRDDAQLEDLVEDPVERVHIENIRQPGDDEHQKYTARHSCGSR